jgi:hypothetical protein
MIAAATGSPGAALVGCATLGVSYPFWSQAVRAEVYALHALFLALMLWLAAGWRRHGGDGRLVGLALLIGLSLGNHMATVLVVPALVVMLGPALRRARNTWSSPTM